MGPLGVRQKPHPGVSHMVSNTDIHPFFFSQPHATQDAELMCSLFTLLSTSVHLIVYLTIPVCHLSVSVLSKRRKNPRIRERLDRSTFQRSQLSRTTRCAGRRPRGQNPRLVAQQLAQSHRSTIITSFCLDVHTKHTIPESDWSPLVPRRSTNLAVRDSRCHDPLRLLVPEAPPNKEGFRTNRVRSWLANFKPQS